MFDGPDTPKSSWGIDEFLFSSCERVDVGNASKFGLEMIPGVQKGSFTISGLTPRDPVIIITVTGGGEPDRHLVLRRRQAVALRDALNQALGDAA